MKLNKSTIDKLQFDPSGPATQYAWDDSFPGFGVRLYSNGAKSYIIKLRVGRKQRVVTVSKVHVQTLQEARNEAREMLMQAHTGTDPMEERRKGLRGPTINSLADDYLERHAKIHKKTWKADERRINRYIKPKLGTTQVSAITRSDIAQIHNQITKNGTPYEANRVLRLLSTIFSYAIQWGYFQGDNPAKGIKLNRETKRDRWITPEELPRLAQAIDEEPSPIIRGAFWLYLLTGLRKGELLNAKWADIDFETQELKIEDTKADRPHYLPLSSAALEVIRTIPEVEGNPYLIAGDKPGKPVYDLKRSWDRIRTKAKVQDVRLHDLRRTVGSWLAQGGNTLHLIGRVLNHSNASTTQVYARFGQNHVKRALDEHGNRILSAAGKLPTGTIAEIQPRRKRA